MIFRHTKLFELHDLSPRFNPITNQSPTIHSDGYPNQATGAWMEFHHAGSNIQKSIHLRTEPSEVIRQQSCDETGCTGWILEIWNLEKDNLLSDLVLHPPKHDWLNYQRAWVKQTLKVKLWQFLKTRLVTSESLRFSKESNGDQKGPHGVTQNLLWMPRATNGRVLATGHWTSLADIQTTSPQNPWFREFSWPKKNTFRPKKKNMHQLILTSRRDGKE